MAARTSAIAAAAGCARGTIYRYFDSKPALLREAIRRRLPDAINLDLARRAGLAPAGEPARRHAGSALLLR
jgi:AcrR family transcriptional regulator